MPNLIDFCGCRFARHFATAALLLLVVASAAGADVVARAEGSERIRVVELQDDMGNTLAVAPVGFEVSVSTLPLSEQTLDRDNSGNGSVTFGGSETSSGTNLTLVIERTTQIECVSTPPGKQGGQEHTVDSFMNFQNSSPQAVVVIVRFESELTAEASATLPGETASFASVRSAWSFGRLPSTLQNCPNGIWASGLLKLGQLVALAGSVESLGPLVCDVAVTVPPGETGSGGSSIGSRCQAESPAAVPTLPAAASAALVLLLATSGFLILRRRGQSTAR